MREDFAIKLSNVSKVYNLYGSHRDQLVDVLGLSRFGIKPRTAPKKYHALRNINLDVPRGQRIGIVGRNGAGKTTLLKLLCQNFAPTTGSVEVNGEVQALMNVGLGFHPEYTGRENVEASLQYNGLKRSEYKNAIDEIMEFCELGEYFDQPFKSYSAGMQARLMFASATAISPDILIVDEVLGAGDAYFVAKSKKRVERLVASGCTMLLVSHSMQQVLELCNQAIWLDSGHIQMQGEAFRVVKAYEEYLYGPIHQLNDVSPVFVDGPPVKSLTDSDECVGKTSSVRPDGAKGLVTASCSKTQITHDNIQEPYFIPHYESLKLTDFGVVSSGFNFIAPGGISRWESTLPKQLALIGFSILTKAGETNSIFPFQPAIFSFSVRVLSGGDYSCRYAMNIQDHMGRTITSVKSAKDHFRLSSGAVRKVNVLFNPIQLGQGEYTVSIAVLNYGPLELLNSAARYDLLSRSFMFKVELPESMLVLGGQFYHSAEWYFSL